MIHHMHAPKRCTLEEPTKRGSWHEARHPGREPRTAYGLQPLESGALSPHASEHGQKVTSRTHMLLVLLLVPGRDRS